MAVQIVKRRHVPLCSGLKLLMSGLSLAGVPGFEPGNGGTKIRCLTAWLHPNREMFKFLMFYGVIGLFHMVNKGEPRQNGRELLPNRSH